MRLSQLPALTDQLRANMPTEAQTSALQQINFVAERGYKGDLHALRTSGTVEAVVDLLWATEIARVATAASSTLSKLLHLELDLAALEASSSGPTAAGYDLLTAALRAGCMDALYKCTRTEGFWLGKDDCNLLGVSLRATNMLRCLFAAIICNAASCQANICLAIRSSPSLA